MTLKKRRLVNKSKISGKLQPSTLMKVFDVPIDLLMDSEENPNEMQDSQFDELVEGIKKEGFDEAVIVMPVYDDKGKRTGKYIIGSGHHRKKAAKLAGYEKLPCVIKEGWDDDARKFALVRRNILHGNVDPRKFTDLFNDLSKRHDKELIKLQMGFVEDKPFQQLYKQVSDSLPEKQKKQLEEAKESIKSVDDLSSVLNTIFKEHGSELDYGYMVFSFGGKSHHYIQIDKETDKRLKELEESFTSADETMEFFRDLVKDVYPGKPSRGKKLKLRK